jgi:hypothetical protein
MTQDRCASVCIYSVNRFHSLQLTSNCKAAALNTSYRPHQNAGRVNALIPRQLGSAIIYTEQFRRFRVNWMRGPSDLQGPLRPFGMDRAGCRQLGHCRTPPVPPSASRGRLHPRGSTACQGGRIRRTQSGPLGHPRADHFSPDTRAANQLPRTEAGAAPCLGSPSDCR